MTPRLPPLFTLAATSLVIVGCGASLPSSTQASGLTRPSTSPRVRCWT